MGLTRCYKMAFFTFYITDKLHIQYINCCVLYTKPVNSLTNSTNYTYDFLLALNNNLASIFSCSSVKSPVYSLW